MNKERLLEVLMVGDAKPLTNEQIAEAEKRCRMRFPAEFKRFIAKWNNATFDAGSNFYIRLYDLTNDSYIGDRVLTGQESDALFEDLLSEVEENKESYPGIRIDIDPADAVLFTFADDMFDKQFYLMIDKNDSEHYWLFDQDEGTIYFCVKSVSAFLDELIEIDNWCDDDERTLKQKLADRIYLTKPEKPSVIMSGWLDDFPGEPSRLILDVSEQDRIHPYPECGIEGRSFAAALPTGDLLPMRFVPAEAGDSRPFWISYYPVPNDQFLPPNRLDDSITSGAAPAEVSAEDAELFCSILTDFFAKSLPDGYAFALPTDAEYQRALKHADETAEKPKTGVFSSFLKLFVRPNPAPEHLTEILKRDSKSASDKPEKLPFYIVLTAKRS